MDINLRVSISFKALQAGTRFAGKMRFSAFDRFRVVLTTIVLLAATSSTLGQTEAQHQGQTDQEPALYTKGVVIEEIDHVSVPSLRNLREGDVLLSWSRGNEHGTLDTPFSFIRMTFEQWPKGVVTLWGRRGPTNRTWILPWQYWVITVRPNFTKPALETYLNGYRLEKSGKIADAEHAWKSISETHTRVAWLNAWLKYHAALGYSRTKQSQESDQAFELALQPVATDPYTSATIWLKWADELRYRDNTGVDKQKSLRALEEAQQIGRETFLTAQICGRLALRAYANGDLDEATRLADKAYSIEQNLHGTANLAIFQLASIAFLRGDLAKAESYYRKALYNVRQHQPTADLGSILNGLGIVALVRGELKTAESYFEQSLRIEQKRPSWLLNRAVVLENLGLAAQEQKSFSKAEGYFLQARRILERLPKVEAFLARNLSLQGDLARRRRDLATAEHLLQQALAIKQQLSPLGLELAWSYADLGDVYLAREDLDRAEYHYLQAEAMREKLAPESTELAEAQGSLAGIKLKRGNYEAAAAFYEKALSTLERQTAHLGGSSNVRAGFRAKHEKYYREYADLLLTQNKPEDAFAVIERSRARTLLEILNAGQINVQNGVNKELLEHESSLRAGIKAKSERRARLLAGQHTQEQLKSVEKEISDLTSEYQDVEARIRFTSPAYAALTQPQPLTAKEIQQQLLDADTMLLEYSLGEERSFVFAVTPDSLHAYELPKKAEIEQQARAVRRLLAEQKIAVRGESQADKRSRMARNRASFDHAVASLGRMVLGPLAQELQNKRLLIVTDSALAYVPFSLLPEPRAPDAAQKGEALPLIVNHEIINLPSASVLAVLRQQHLQRKTAPKAVAVLADPVFDQHDPRLGGLAARKTPAPQTRSATRDTLDELLASDFSANMLTRSAADLGLAREGQLALPRLYFSRQEADAILAVTPAGKGLKAVDFNASRATATSSDLSQYRIVHFATHGLLNSEHPELSGLVLSLVDKHGKPQNGFLTLQDIYNLELPADLVVLSACETGLGKEISGEGLIGLTRGFMYAGANRVVASLWKVSDAATAQLMAHFYRAMEQDGLAPAAALRAAQIAMWKQHRWRHPYYWAAFQIQGEWK